MPPLDRRARPGPGSSRARPVRRGPKPPPKPPKTEQETLREWLDRYAKARVAGDLLAARRAAIKAKETAPRAPDARFALGLTAFELGNWQEAALELQAYRRFTGERRHDPMIARCHIERGRPEKALELLEDLTRDAVPEPDWAAGQVERARAMDARGNPALGTRILETALRAAKDKGARAVLDAAIERRTGG